VASSSLRTIAAALEGEADYARCRRGEELDSKLLAGAATLRPRRRPMSSAARESPLGKPCSRPPQSGGDHSVEEDTRVEKAAE